MRRFLTAMTVLCLVWASLAASARADIIYVSQYASGVGDGTSWDDAYWTIQDALDAADHGDEIWVAEGTYYENLNVSRAIALYGSFTGTESDPSERPTGDPTTIVDADVDGDPETEDGNCLNAVNPSLTVLDGFHFINGAGTEYFSGDGYGNRAGGVYLLGFHGRITNVVFENNTTSGRGGGLYIVSNYNEEGADPLLLEQVIFRNNTGHEGGGLYLESIENEGRFDIIFEDVVFDGNTATRGGGLYTDLTQWSEGSGDPNTDPPGARLNFNWCEFAGNSADAGGGAYLSREMARYKPRLFDDADFYRTTFSSNSARRGGALFVDVDAYLSNSTLSNNQAYGDAATSAGGALFITGYNGLSGTFLTVQDNTSAGRGGGAALADGGRLTLWRSTFADNTGADGGAIHSGNDAILQVTGSQITGNTASGRGGGIFLSQTGGFSIESNRITGNTAGASGGGLSLEHAPLIPYPDYPATILNNTISDNHAPAAGGVDFGEGSVADFVNNIVAFNDSGIRGEAGIAVRFYNNNIYGNGTKDVQGISTPVGRRSNTSVDPLFVNRAAGDYRLSATSPMKDAGDSGPFTNWAIDADGNKRVQGNSVDIGAYEVAGPAAMFMRFDVSPETQSSPGTLTKQPRVSVIGPDGSVLTSYNGPVTISLKDETGTQGATLGGTKTVNAVNGVATFTDLTIDKPGLAYVLAAAAPSRGGTDSRAFTITVPVAHVSPSGSDGADGSTWATAKRSLHLGLASAEPGGTVWLARGAYRGSFMTRSVGILGGFAGSESSAGMRNPRVNETILDGQEIGTPLNIQTSGGNLVIDGLTIRNGRGPGVLSFPANVTISNNIIGGNTDSGILAFGNNTRITRNRIRSNTAVHRGGGISIASGTTTVDNNLIDGNTAAYGSGVDIYSIGPVLIVNNTIVGNQGPNGAVHMSDGTVTLANNIIANNASGVVADAYFTPTVTLIKNILYNVPPPYKNLPPGPSDILADPMFRAPGISDYRPAPGSPAIDAGDTDIAVGLLDFLGNPRIGNGIVDIGAYEVVAGPQIADAIRALRIAGGLLPSTPEDMDTLNPENAGASQNRVDALDALRLLRQSLGQP